MQDDEEESEEMGSGNDSSPLMLSQNSLATKQRLKMTANLNSPLPANFRNSSHSEDGSEPDFQLGPPQNPILPSSSLSLLQSNLASSSVSQFASSLQLSKKKHIPPSASRSISPSLTDDSDNQKAHNDSDDEHGKSKKNKKRKKHSDKDGKKKKKKKKRQKHDSSESESDKEEKDEKKQSSKTNSNIPADSNYDDTDDKKKELKNADNSVEMPWEEVSVIPMDKMTRDQFHWYYKHRYEREERALLFSEDTFNKDANCGDRVDRLLELKTDDLPNDHVIEATIKRWESACIPLYDDTEHYTKVAEEIFANQCQTESEKFRRWREMTEALQEIHRAIRIHHIDNLPTHPSKAKDAVEVIQSAIDKMFIMLAVNQSAAVLDTNQLINYLKRMWKMKKTVVQGLRHNRSTTEENLDDDDKKPIEFLKLMHKTLDCAADQKCIRLGNTRIQVPIYVKGQFTKCYKDFGETGDISEFIEEVVSADDEFWNLLNSRPGFAEQLEKRLKKTKDPRLPQVTRKKEWHGFLDGMYDGVKMKFYRYDSVSFRRLPKNQIACAFHHCYFNDEETEWYIRCGGDTDFLKIPEPTQSICKLQEWPEDEVIHVLGEAAAMFHQKIRPEMLHLTEKKDQKKMRHPFQQHMSKHLGPGGCGKTTLLKIFSLFFDPQDIAQFKTHDENVFGMEHIIESLAIMGYDIGRNWSIDPHFLFTLIDGSWIKLSRKFKSSILYFVDQYIMIAMNDYLGMADTGGALSRRILMHMWEFLPTSSNSNLVVEAVAWVGFLMKKCCLALKYLTEKVYEGKMATREHPKFPKTMKKNLDDFRLQATPILAFFESNLVVHDDEVNKGYYIDKATLDTRFHDWSKRNGITTNTKLTRATLSEPMKHFRLKMFYQTRPDFPAEWRRKYKENVEKQKQPQNNNNSQNGTGSNRNNLANKTAGLNNGVASVVAPILKKKETEWIVGCTLRGMEEDCKAGIKQYELMVLSEIEKEKQARLLGDAGVSTGNTGGASTGTIPPKKSPLIAMEEDDDPADIAPMPSKSTNGETENDIILFPVPIEVT